MSTNHTLQHDLSPRVVKVAALLAESCLNPDVQAFNRSKGGARFCRGRYIVAPSSARREMFWFSVGRAISDAYDRRSGQTDYERAVRRDIDAARAAIAAATGAEHG